MTRRRSGPSSPRAGVTADELVTWLADLVLNVLVNPRPCCAGHGVDALRAAILAQAGTEAR